MGKKPREVKTKATFTPLIGTVIPGLTDETGRELHIGDRISLMRNTPGRAMLLIIGITETGRAAACIGRDFTTFNLPLDNSMRKNVRYVAQPPDWFDADNWLDCFNIGC